MLDRFGVAKALREIGMLLEAEGANPFKIRAYERGARAIERLRDDLATLVAEERLTEVEGIGAALAATISDLVRTGETPLLAKLRKAMPAGVLELLPVLSLPKIKALHEALGITSLEGLEEAAKSGRLQGVKGFGARTAEKILADIAQLKTRGEDLHLHLATQEGDHLLSHVRASEHVARAELAGALRRRTETVERLEVVIATADAVESLLHVARFPSVTNILASAPGEVSLRLAAGLNVVARAVDAADFEGALLHHTGASEHLDALTARAAARGFTLDSRGLAKGGKRVRVATEEALYERLGLPFIAPEMREGAGECEWAEAGGRAEDLVSLGDIQGMVHCHTLYSDGKNTVEEMARGAAAMGMKYITITDHSPTASYAGGVTLDRLKRQWEEIDRVQETVKVKLLRGTESDILQDGSLDYPDAILEKMDVVIASVHNRHKLDADGMTRRVVGALRKPQFKIWGHALGRLIGRRPPFAVHMDEVLDAAAESRVAIEINGDPHRLDMEPRYVREARRRGLKFVVSVDAHSVANMQNLRYGIDMARRGWLTKGDVLNTLPPAAFQKAVKP